MVGFSESFKGFQKACCSCVSFQISSRFLTFRSSSEQWQTSYFHIMPHLICKPRSVLEVLSIPSGTWTLFAWVLARPACWWHTSCKSTFKTLPWQCMRRTQRFRGLGLKTDTQGLYFWHWKFKTFAKIAQMCVWCSSSQLHLELWAQTWLVWSICKQQRDFCIFRLVRGEISSQEIHQDRASGYRSTLGRCSWWLWSRDPRSSNGPSVDSTLRHLDQCIRYSE